MRDHELDVFGRSPPTTTHSGTGRPFAAAPAPPPRRNLSTLSTTALCSSSVATSMMMMEEEEESAASLSGSTNGITSIQASVQASGGTGAPLGFGFGFNGNGSNASGGNNNGIVSSSSGGAKRPLAYASHNRNRGAAISPHSALPCSALHASASSMQPPSSNKRSRPTPTLSAIRHRLASKLVNAVQKTPHSDAARPYTVVVECLSGTERGVCCAAAAATVGVAMSAPSAATRSGMAVPYGLFFAPDQALTRVGWEVRTTATATIWTMYGNAASEWIQNAMEGGGNGGGANNNGVAQPKQPYHIHPVPYDGPIRVGYGGRRERMYAYAGIEALEAKFESGGNGGGVHGGGGDGMLTLTVRTYLAGLVDEAKVTFSPWG